MGLEKQIKAEEKGGDEGMSCNLAGELEVKLQTPSPLFSHLLHLAMLSFTPHTLLSPQRGTDLALGSYLSLSPPALGFYFRKDKLVT